MSSHQQMLQECRQLIGAATRTFSFWNRRTYLHTPRSKWLTSDNAMRIVFDDRTNLLAHGEVVWGHIVQANVQIFDEGNVDVPALVLLCPNPEVVIDPDDLGVVSQSLFALKNTVPNEGHLQDIAATLTNEHSTPRALAIPRSMSRRVPMVMTTIFFARKHLPGRRLCKPYLPILISPSSPGFATPLPGKYWPANLKDT